MFLITTMSLIINLWMMVVNSAIPLVFLQVMSQVLTFIINIDCSLDQNQEADKWLFDVSAWDGKK
jgi:type III secretion system FlhB-like substrate exporter